MPDLHLKPICYFQLSWRLNLIFSFEIQLWVKMSLVLNPVQEKLKKDELENFNTGPIALAHRVTQGI